MSLPILFGPPSGRFITDTTWSGSRTHHWLEALPGGTRQEEGEDPKILKEPHEPHETQIIMEILRSGSLGHHFRSKRNSVALPRLAFLVSVKNLYLRPMSCHLPIC